MAKQVGNLIGRTVVGIISIVITATVSVIAQQYLVPLLHPPAAEPPHSSDRPEPDFSSESVSPGDDPESNSQLDSVVPIENPLPPSAVDKQEESGLEEEKPLAQPDEDTPNTSSNKIMKQFWEKLNR